ncbi:MAG: sulfite exporter TauE/SafE family protein [Candidatus Obscuribacterales bacterium]|nr:sulfite exporter TauE/SafE family protein [Candidatus Obscuribacterales bacterium]
MDQAEFLLLVFILSLLSGAIAAVAGFGIGSFLTPLFALQIGTKLAVAATSIPHFLATLFRFWMLRRFIDKDILVSFGISSAAGGLTGALIHSHIENTHLNAIFGLILVVAGAGGVSGFSEKIRFHGIFSFFAGAVSGLLGGLVGNQGGIRSAALLGFNLDKTAFVATTTLIGLIVDCVRMPVYFANDFNNILALKEPILIATAGALAGTLLGKYFLQNLDQKMFKRLVSIIVLLLGIWMLWTGILPE